MQSRTDAQLVELSRGGDRQAFDELIRRYQAQASRLACLLVGDRSEAEDLAQEAFLRAWQNLNVLSDPAKFAAWFRRIVFGVSIDWMRAFRADLYRLAGESSELALFSFPASDAQALDVLEATDLRERVWAAVARLPERYRLPLTMFHFDGLSHARVAQALNIPESTVRSLVTRARARLRPMLAPYAEQVLPGLHDLLEDQKMNHKPILHLVDGDSVAGTLRESGLPGEVVVYGDLLYEGPAPSGLKAKQWLAARVQFYANSGYGPREGVEQFLRNGEQAVANFHRHSEVILWFDHHLMDQILLIRLLDWFASQSLNATRLSLISIGEYPGVKPFIAFGQLSADQLYSLGDTRIRITDAHLRLGKAAWQVFTADEPSGLEELLNQNNSALPFLAAAIRRHLEEFPSLENGLSRTEQAALTLLRNQASLSAGRLFAGVQQQEQPLFMGDWSFYRLLKQMASGPHPLITADPVPEQIPQWQRSAISITECGQRVLDGADDRVRLNGIDEWRGGVHLTGGQPIWRWDRSSKKLVRA